MLGKDRAAVIRADHAKGVALMREFLEGKGYFTAMRAMEFASSFHKGTRKDGITPEFAHQLFLKRYVRSVLGLLMFPEETLAVAALHDLCEDFEEEVGFDDITAEFGPRIGHATRLMTKKHRGIEIPYEIYFDQISKDPIASVVKGADRSHNILSMHTANWDVAKQTRYLNEVRTWFLPMLKSARKRFPEQRCVYENLKSFLVVQMTHIELSLDMARRLAELEQPDSTRAFAGP